MSTNFHRRVLSWFDKHGRHDLPWQRDITPYRVWVSEIMLQQTQVATVIPYFERFMTRFPSVQALASAPEDDVLHHWTGLGYYARARNFHAAAKTLVDDHDGAFPRSVDQLCELKGIGRSTAGAIAAIAMGAHAPILDGNVKRVLARHNAVPGWPEQTAVRNRLWEIATDLTPKTRTADYTQAMMDLGATVCTRSKPRCDACPLAADCEARTQDRIKEIPGKKPRKAIPVRTVTFHLIEDGSGAVLLEKRPPSGIWGSLYSFPETQDDQPLPALSAARIDPHSKRSLAPLRHTFSHFHLDISPLVYRGAAHDVVAESDRWLWHPLDGTVQVGLAAPVKKLLQALAEH